MSGNTSSSTANVKTEIARLAKTLEEKASLLSYFTQNKDQQSDAFSDLSLFDTDEDKLVYLKTFLPEQPVAKRPRVGDPSFEGILEVVASLKNIQRSSILSTDIIQRENVEVSNPGSSTDAQEQDIIRNKSGDFAVIDEPALYVRQAYKDFYQFVNKPNSDPRFLITGTSGVGKSCFLLYLLIQLLCNFDNVTVVYHPRQGKLCYCFENSNLKVGEISDFLDRLHSPNAWYLVDSVEPMTAQARTVAVSPNSLNDNQFQEFSKIVVKKYYMPPWTIEELKACREHIFKEVPEDLMLDIFDRAGGVPRYVLRHPARLIKDHDLSDEGIYDMIVNRSTERIEGAISEIRSFDDLLQCFTENASYVKISNRIVHRWPDPSYMDHYSEWASNYIYEAIMRKLEKFRWDVIFQKIRNLLDVTNSRGIMFELYVIHHFTIRKVEGFWYQMRCLENNDSRIMKFKLYVPEKSIQYIRTAEDLSNYNQDHITIRPKVKNFGAADLFTMPDYVFQITVSKKHPIKQKELVKIIPNMLAYRRNSNAKIRLVFVVPDDIYDDFKYQRYVTPTKDDGDDLDGFKDVERLSSVLNNVEQWVLKFDLSMQQQESS